MYDLIKYLTLFHLKFVSIRAVKVAILHCRINKMFYVCLLSTINYGHT